jgi:hypothetical protein
MSDTEPTELRVAAAEGAAAAVDAVTDEQDRRETEEQMATETAVATGAADQAAAEATQAAEAAQIAAEAAVSATETAQQASGTAQEAANEAAATRADVDDLRETVTRGWQDMRSYLDERFNSGGGSNEQPTEVVVTHAATDTPGSNGSDTGSAGSAGDNATGGGPDNGAAARRRHKFGARR